MLAKASKFAPSVETDAESILVGPRGTVIRWRGRTQDQPALLTLDSTTVDEKRWAWKATACVVLFAVAVMAFARWPRAIAGLRQLWPEIIAVVAAYGWLTWGLSFIAIVMLFVAGAGRVLLSRSQLRQWRAVRHPALAGGNQDITPQTGILP